MSEIGDKPLIDLTFTVLGGIILIITALCAPILVYFVRKEKRDVTIAKDLQQLKEASEKHADWGEDRDKKLTEKVVAEAETVKLQDFKIAILSDDFKDLKEVVKDHEGRLRKLESGDYLTPKRRKDILGGEY